MQEDNAMDDWKGFGSEIATAEPPTKPRYPADISREVHWNNMFTKITRNCIKRRLSGIRIRSIEQVSQRDWYEIIELTNVNLNTNEITRYNISQAKRNRIIEILLEEVITDDGLRGERDNYFDESRFVPLHPNEKRLEKIENNIRNKLMQLCCQHKAWWCKIWNLRSNSISDMRYRDNIMNT